MSTTVARRRGPGVAKRVFIASETNGPSVHRNRAEGELSDLARQILAFEHDRLRHDRNKEVAIRLEFGMSPARYYQVLGRVIDSPAALAHDPQLVTRLQRIRDARVDAIAHRGFTEQSERPEKAS